MPPYRVLLIDDDQSTRASVKAFLETRGFQVIEASSGDEALSSWSSFAPQIVVTDNRMGGLASLDVIRHINQRVQVPSVVFSGHVDDDLREAALSLGSEVVEKPDLEKLVSTIEKQLSG